MVLARLFPSPLEGTDTSLNLSFQWMEVNCSMFTEMISLNLYQFLLKVKEIIWLVPSIVDREKDGDDTSLNLSCFIPFILK
jgi:hypothetical protein